VAGRANVRQGGFMDAVERASYMLRIGFWSAIVATVAAVIFGASVVFLIASGPTATWEGLEAYVATYDVFPVYLTNISSLAIAPAFVLMIGALLAIAPRRHRAIVQTALTFAGAYLVVIGVNYVFQTTVVRAAIEGGAYEGLGLAVMGNPASVFWMGELVGYSFMILAGLCLVPLFSGSRSATVIRAVFILNGVTTAVAVVAYFVTVDAMNPLVAGSLGIWCVSWPIATGLIAHRFWRPMSLGEVVAAPLAA
jgi:hypothetical protein